jgi:hypothetical protein
MFTSNITTPVFIEKIRCLPNYLCPCAWHQLFSPKFIIWFLSILSWCMLSSLPANMQAETSSPVTNNDTRQIETSRMGVTMAYSFQH